MKRFPENLSAQDRRTHRRWVRGLFLFYSAAIVVAAGVTFMNRPVSELTALNHTQTAGLKVTAMPMAVSSAARSAAKP